MTLESVVLAALLLLDSFAIYMVFSCDPHGTVNRFLGCLLVPITLTNLGMLLLRNTDGLVPVGLAQALASYGSLLFLGLAYHLSFYYPRTRVRHREKALCLGVYALSAVVGTMITRATWGVGGAFTALWLRATPDSSLPFFAVLAPVVFMLGAVLWRYVAAFASALTPGERRIVLLMAVGFTLLSISLFVSYLFFDTLSRWFWLYCLGSALHVAFFAGLALRLGFVDLRAVFRLFVAYPVLAACLAAVYQLGLKPANAFLERALSVDDLLLLSAELIFGTTQLLPLVRRALSGVEDRIFPSITSLRSAMKDVQAAIAEEIDVDGFCATVVAFFMDDLKIKNVSLFLKADATYDPYRPCRDERGTHGALTGDLPGFGSDGPLVRALSSRRVVPIGHLALGSSDKREMERLERLKGVVAMALGDDTALRGFLILGSGRSGVWDGAALAELELASLSLSVALERCLSHGRALELERKQARIERMAAMSELMAGIAHEIRNPLSIIAAAAETLERPDVGPEARARCGAYIHEEAERLSGLIGSMLSSFAPRFEFDHRPIDVVPVVSRVMDMVRASFKDRRISVELEGSRSALAIIDKEALTQVCVNLILNAYEFALEGGTVRVVIDDEGLPGQVRIDVRDTGPTIPAEIERRIFEPFYTTRKDGTGLGLPVSRRLARSAGGELEHLYDGGVNVFRITIPKAGGPVR